MIDDTRVPLTPERLAEIREWCRAYAVEPNTCNMPEAGTDALHHIARYVPTLLAEVDRLTHELQATHTHLERLRSMLADAERRARGGR